MKPSVCKIVGLIMISFTLFSCEKSGSGVETPKVLPSVSSSSISNLTNNTLTFGGNVTNAGDSPVTSRGVCWSLSSNPKITDSKSESGTGLGSFSCNITGLTPRTKYHVRSFATNSSGTSYGSDISFFTLDNDMLPVSVAPLLTKNWTVFTWPYNIYYPAYSGSNAVNGKLAAPCGPTTLSRVLAYWKGSITASGTIDAYTTTNDCHFLVRLDTVSINYNNLPAVLTSSSGPSEYRDVAKLFLVAGAVSLTNFIDVGTPGEQIINAFKQYFNVSDNVRFIKRWDYSKAEWIKLLKTELAAGRPLMIAARTLDSPDPGQPGNVAGHWFNIEGYNDKDEFYINYNYSGLGFSGYFDVDNFGEYCKSGLVVAGFEPK